MDVIVPPREWSRSTSFLSVKEGYKWLLERSVTTKDDEGRTELIPCKIEEREPVVFWNESYRISGLLELSK